MPRCQYCDKEIIWIKSDATDKRVPLDARPTTAYQRTGPEAGKPVQVHINHFVTCPGAKQARADKDAKTEADADQAALEAAETAADEYIGRVMRGLCDCTSPSPREDKMRGTVCKSCSRRIRTLKNTCPNCHKAYGEASCGVLHGALKERIIEVTAARARAVDHAHTPGD